MLNIIDLEKYIFFWTPIEFEVIFVPDSHIFFLLQSVYCQVRILNVNYSPYSPPPLKKRTPVNIFIHEVRINIQTLLSLGAKTPQRFLDRPTVICDYAKWSPFERSLTHIYGWLYHHRGSYWACWLYHAGRCKWYCDICQWWYIPGLWVRMLMNAQA